MRPIEIIEGATGESAAGVSQGRRLSVFLELGTGRVVGGLRLDAGVSTKKSRDGLLHGSLVVN